ncbi:MAG TPA: DUF6691 family protein [Steroidobacteraceae bacterium]|nr:DUF6691 family protein [Steroidobacteraceae bacterium]
MRYIKFLLLGIIFGIALYKAEIVSWFRIQEMFRFDAFHMFGIIGSAVVTASLVLTLLARVGARDRDGAPVELEPKELGTGIRYIAGGTIFGVGWAFTGACPGPLVALVGAGVPAMIITLVCALAGTWAYGVLRPRLPH